MMLPEKIQFLRKRQGLSQEELAERLVVSRQSVSKWEQGLSQPEISKVIQLASIFGVTTDQLLMDDQDIEQTDVPLRVENDEVANATILETMFCTECGKENASDSAFCGYCGLPFSSYMSADGRLTKADMDLAYYRANLKMQQQSLLLQQRQFDTDRQSLEEQRRQTDLQTEQLLLHKKQYKSMAKCPRCGSSSLSGNKKGYGIGKGVIGAMAVGPLGLVAGNIGAKKVVVTCMNCGHRFKK